MYANVFRDPLFSHSLLALRAVTLHTTHQDSDLDPKAFIQEFLKIMGTFSGGPRNKDYSMYIGGRPVFRKQPYYVRHEAKAIEWQAKNKMQKFEDTLRLSGHIHVPLGIFPITVKVLLVLKCITAPSLKPHSGQQL